MAKKNVGAGLFFGILTIAFSIMFIYVVCSVEDTVADGIQTIPKTDSVEQAFTSMASLQNQFDNMSNEDKERFCYEIWNAEYNAGSSGNLALNSMLKKHTAELEEVSKWLFYQSVPEEVMDYWPIWFGVSIPKADNQYHRQPFILCYIQDTDEVKHFTGDMSYFTALKRLDEINIVHYLTDSEAICFASSKIPKGMEFAGIAYGGYLIFRDEQGKEFIQPESLKIVEFSLWKEETSYQKPTYYVVD